MAQKLQICMLNLIDIRHIFGTSPQFSPKGKCMAGRGLQQDLVPGLGRKHIQDASGWGLIIYQNWRVCVHMEELPNQSQQNLFYDQNVHPVVEIESVFTTAEKSPRCRWRWKEKLLCVRWCTCPNV